MWEQIKETVRYFRNKGIIDADKIVQAVMSFPNLIGNFEQWVFPIRQEDGTMKTAMDISNHSYLVYTIDVSVILSEARRA